ncbi:unnamed protein product, partial [Meganyctiphanes norvegica]
MAKSTIYNCRRFFFVFYFLALIDVCGGFTHKKYHKTVKCVKLNNLEESLLHTIKKHLIQRSPEKFLINFFLVRSHLEKQHLRHPLTRFSLISYNLYDFNWVIPFGMKIVRQTTSTLTIKIELTLASSPTFLLTSFRERLCAKEREIDRKNERFLSWPRVTELKYILFYFTCNDHNNLLDFSKEMRYTKGVSMWPVGLVTHTGLSTPIVSLDGKFVGWYDGWIAGRKFPVDMACFAVNVQYFKKTNATMPYSAGYEEDGFLKKLNIKPEEIEFKADGCTKIYVWHTQTKKNYASDRQILDDKYNGTNLRLLQQAMIIKPPTEGPRQTLDPSKVKTLPAKKSDNNNNVINTEDEKKSVKR